MAAVGLAGLVGLVGLGLWLVNGTDAKAHLPSAALGGALPILSMPLSQNFAETYGNKISCRSDCKIYGLVIESIPGRCDGGRAMAAAAEAFDWSGEWGLVHLWRVRSDNTAGRQARGTPRGERRK